MPASKVEKRNKIRRRIRGKISGIAVKPRLAVFRSNTDIYVQLIDDAMGHTLAAASSREDDIKSQTGTKTEKSKLVGQLIARRALDAGIETVVFDRGGRLYHGRIKALAEGAREGGLKF